MLLKAKKGKGERGFTLIELIGVVVITGIMGGVAMPKFIGLSDEARTSAARAAGAAMSSSISVRHSEYLLRGNAYTANDVINDTIFESGVNTPTATGNVITLVSWRSTYNWIYTPQSGADSAYLTEDSSSAFP